MHLLLHDHGYKRAAHQRRYGDARQGRELPGALLHCNRRATREVDAHGRLLHGSGDMICAGLFDWHVSILWMLWP